MFRGKMGSNVFIRSRCMSFTSFIPAPLLEESSQHFSYYPFTFSRRVWIKFVSHPGREHIPPTFAQHIGGDRGQLDIGGFQHFLHTIDLSRTLLDQTLAVPGEIAQFTNRGRWNETGGCRSP